MVSGYPRHLALRQDYQAEFGDLFVPAILKKISDFGGSLVKNPRRVFLKQLVDGRGALIEKNRLIA